MAIKAKQMVKLMKAMEDPDFGNDMSDDAEERAKYHENMAQFTLDTIEEIMDSEPITKEVLRQYILIEGANAIRAVSDRAKGKQPNGMDRCEAAAQNMLFDAVIPILHAAGDLKKIEAGTVKEVLKLIKDGDITMVEAKELIDMIKDKPVVVIA